MPASSAGLLLYRRRQSGPHVLLVHPGGPFWARRDLGIWSIPKGELTSEEAPLHGALREVREELGVSFAGPFLPLTPVRQRGGKTVEAWATESEWDPAKLKSNTFEIEWPPRSGARQSFPEIDRAEWFPLDEARRRILSGQIPLLDELERILSTHSA